MEIHPCISLKRLSSIRTNVVPISFCSLLFDFYTPVFAPFYHFSLCFILSQKLWGICFHLKFFWLWPQAAFHLQMFSCNISHRLSSISFHMNNRLCKWTFFLFCFATPEMLFHTSKSETNIH